ncbi:PQQ-binding-like beta-propeller repeat protein [Tahibacter soli]|uniref:PQQ-binding-like beta-propeller repeat protein n=1 Tax=Tahibacter soli TaxID=2983605 RepID=A0A9X3YP25_9GAMM|nr:PQQ-binding-like beta-propeller repeat protein [Tahibacter soli]MDC8014328.1 PQQ-binding-like beta-propeller repeat protein [Tahibacter soli]
MNFALPRAWTTAALAFAAAAGLADGARAQPAWSAPIEAGPDIVTEFSRYRQNAAVTDDGGLAALALLGHVPSGYDPERGVAVVKRDAVTGAERWRRVFPPSSTSIGNAFAIAALPGGDVAVTGQADYLTRLDGATGNTVWSKPMPLARYYARAMSVDSGGNLVTGANQVSDASSVTTYVAKRAGADGSLLWETQLTPGGQFSVNLFVFAASDDDVLVVSGHAPLLPAPVTPHYYAARLDSATGAVLWRTELDQAFFTGADPADVALTADGDLVFGGNRAGLQAWIGRIDGDTGTPQWLVNHAGLQAVTDLAVTSDGDVVAAGGETYASATTGWAVARFAAADGAATWFRQLPLNPTRGRGKVIGIAPDGTVLLTGSCAVKSLCIAGVSPLDGADRWWYEQNYPTAADDFFYLPEAVFDADGALIVSVALPSANVTGGVSTVTQQRLIGPWVDAVFKDGFEE